MNKPFSKILQNIDRNKTVKSDVSAAEMEKQTHFEKKRRVCSTI